MLHLTCLFFLVPHSIHSFILLHIQSLLTQFHSIHSCILLHIQSLPTQFHSIHSFILLHIQSLPTQFHSIHSFKLLHIQSLPTQFCIPNCPLPLTAHPTLHLTRPTPHMLATSVTVSVFQGDGNVRYFEIVNEPPYSHYLSQYQSGSPQRGLGTYYLPLR